MRFLSAQIVCYPFHLARNANLALDQVRRQLQRKPDMQSVLRGLPSRGKSFKREIFYARHRLAKGKERLTLDERKALYELFQVQPRLALAGSSKRPFAQSMPRMIAVR